MVELTPNVGICDVIRTPIVANSVDIIDSDGTLISGSVSDIQNWEDNNSIHFQEVTGVPGFNIQFTFANVRDFCFIGISAYYDGTHYIQTQIFDDENSVWRLLWTFDRGLDFNYRFSDLPVGIASRRNYINGSNEVLIRLYHPTTGNASHDLFINYASIIG